MKKSITLGLLCLLTGIFSATAQVSISPDGSKPDSSAMLDIKSANRGLLPPRLTSDEILRISHPASGLMVYCIDCKDLLYYNGQVWISRNGDTLKFEIGNMFQGGKIFYITSDNEAYIISDDLKSGLYWGCFGTLLNIPNNGLIGVGEGNTAAIVAGCPDPATAANFCQSLNYNGFSDWFLPSRGELVTAINILSNDGWSGKYWSSNEANANLAYRINSDGSLSPSTKAGIANVRCVRYTAGPYCFQQSDPANAGPDMLDLEGTNVSLHGSSPGTASGIWTISSGAGGELSDFSDPTATFYGLSGNSYTLVWTVTDSCGTSRDDVNVSFQCFPLPDIAYAGTDQLNINGISCTLGAYQPYSGSGVWSSNGGYITSPSNPLSTFFGLKGTQYTLQWTVTTDCGSNYDWVNISFADDPCPPPSSAYAGGGPLLVAPGNIAVLNANTPASGIGTWSIDPVYSDEEGEILEPNNPKTAFNGESYKHYRLIWTIEKCGVESSDYIDLYFTCMPTQWPDAGADQLNHTGTSATLSAWPQYEGTWSIVEGEGGELVNPYNWPAWDRILNGLPGHSYVVKFSISYCSLEWDFVNVSFLCDVTPTSANAGSNQMLLPGTYTTLQGNTPSVGTGRWSVVGNATGAIIENESSPTSGFTGLPGFNYTLRWTITSSCGSFSSDDMYLSFVCTPVTANAGPDQINHAGNMTTLQANTPPNGTYQWSIISGTEGLISSVTDPHSYFTGLAGNSYTLRWTVITNSCGIHFDDVVISFQCDPQPTTANAGPDQLNLTTLTTTLQGNAPAVGTGQWSIISGTGGNIANPSNPASSFTGIEGQSYTLRWSITACSTSSDDVVISIACPTANAGPDQLNIQGTTTTLQGNTPFAGSGMWSIVSGAGGNIVAPTNPSSTFTGIGGSNYKLRWTITSANCETVNDSVVIQFACGSAITINHVAGNVAPVTKITTYGTVTNISGEPSKCWITSNLGSDHQATAFNDATEASAGWYWQFNRMQGFMHDGTTRTPNTSWITPIDENSDWLTAYDPCALELGAGWRLPTSTEWTNVDASGNWTNWNGPWNSELKLHAAGYLYYANGSLIGRGSYGYYASNTQQASTHGYFLFFYSSSCGVNGQYKANGFSARCLRN